MVLFHSILKEKLSIEEKSGANIKLDTFNRKNRAGELLLTLKFSHIADFSFNILENFKAAN